MSTIAELDKSCAEAIHNMMEGDREMDHMAADKLIVELLKKLGCTETVAAYEAVGKWYA